MKTSARCTLFLLLGVGLSACENGFAVRRDARLPRIKSMTVAGIPEKDIRINEDEHTITIRLPGVVPEGGLIPVFQLTGKAIARVSDSPWPSGQGKLPISHLATCGWGAPTGPGIEVVDESIRKPYFNTNGYGLVYIKPEGCLEPIVDKPIGYKLGGNNLHVYLPVKNLYSSPRINSLHVKNLETGVTASSVLTEGVCANEGYTEIANGNITKIYNYVDVPFLMKTEVQFVPGRYQISIGLDCNNSMLVFPQPLVIGE